ncbi:MAG: tRNA pseudouridine(55) synthase TruB [Clostridia bacterium]|nr:tRNA pseudouridine(55) synthase TruB [Clostridia bacterium]
MAEIINEPCGVLIVNKPEGPTSHDIVNKIRRLYSTKKVGHTGTLDPLATGVLVVLIGRAAKACEYSLSDRKKYTATLRLGIETDTEDTTGNILRGTDVSVSESDVQAILGRFSGRIMQIPPMYSALKVGGKKLCDIAREGGTVERQARPVDIYSISAEHIVRNDYKLIVECSAGTYIRTLCSDIGKALGCGGTMATLERSAACGFSIEDAHTIEEIELLSSEERLALLRPVEEIFCGLDAVKLPAFYEKLFRSGCEIYLKRAKLPEYPVGTRLRVLDSKGDFFALGEVKEYENGLAVKSIKLFSLN